MAYKYSDIVPVRAFLATLLEDAAKAHHEYEQNELNGANDAEWAKWYAKHIAGKLAREHALVWDAIYNETEKALVDAADRKAERQRKSADHFARVQARGHSDKFDK